MSNLAVGKYRRSNSYEVKFPTLPSLNLQPGRADLIQAPYEHDILNMEFSKESLLWFKTVKTGIPVQFTWKQGSMSATWYGYVSSITRSVVGQTVNVMEVRCVGSTFPLKDRATRVFTNSTIPAAVQKIVTEFGFRYIGEDDDRVFEQLTMAGHSYWEWIQEQARRIGYAVVVNGMDFFFKPLDSIYAQTVTTVPVLSFFDNDLPINKQILDRTLDGMKITNGEYIENSKALRTNKLTGGVNPITGKPVYSVVSPSKVGTNLRESVSDVLFSEIRTEQVVDSTRSATSAAGGAAQLSRFNLPASIRCQGDPRIQPFSPIFIDGTGELTDGFWIAEEVHHSFAWVGDYRIDMKVGTDGMGPSSKAFARQEPKTVIGMVNLTEALRNNISSITPTTPGAVKLVTKTLASNTLGQGFHRTPARWIAGSEVKV